ncbi:MAG: rod shape-determining protein MreC [Azospirillum sp.]|nr:rod shape-determining protein MreC [Azospirillum sp.]
MLNRWDGSVKPPSVRPAARLTALRTLLQRFSFLSLILTSLALMVLGKVDAQLVEDLRARVIDAFVPILDAISRPAATAAKVVEQITELQEIRHDNEQLRLENARLLQWRQAALRLEAENTSLRSLLHFKAEPPVRYITARVIAVPGGSFLRSLVVLAGRRDGVRRGQAALAGPSMVGRVVEVGEWSARILLITDINHRVPVILENSRQRAVLTGDNSELPRLLYLPPDAPVAVGDRVVTSGHGGMFPPGLPIGVVSLINERGVKVQPLVDLSRIEHLRIVEFGLPDDLLGDGERPGPGR